MCRKSLLSLRAQVNRRDYTRPRQSKVFLFLSLSLSVQLSQVSGLNNVTKDRTGLEYLYREKVAKL